MARDLYQNTIAVADPDGTLRALANVLVYVYNPGTLDLATIYTGRTGVAQAGNPLQTDSTGAVEFYAEVGEYDIRTRDTNAIPRITDRTVQWNAINASDQGIPTSKLTRDAGIDLLALAADVRRQQHQIGEIINWWRPSSEVPIPSGFEICDGRTIDTADHDFGTGSPIQLPDLRNCFLIGADPFKSDGTASSNGDGSALSGRTHPNAPGIRGIGGSNTSKNLQHSHQFAHTHNVPGVDHLHVVPGVDHLHGAPAIGVSVSMGNANRGDNRVNYGASFSAPEQFAWVAHVHSVGASGAASSTGAADRSLSTTSNGADRSLNATTNSQSTTTTDNGTGSSAADMRPKHYGVLKLMKVRWA